MPRRFARISLKSAALASIARSGGLALGGLLAGGAVFGVFAMTAAPGPVILSFASHHVTRALPAIAFDESRSLTDVQILGGVSGEALGARQPDLAQASAPGTILKSELSPVTRDRLSAGDCISLTTASGQKLSFRIIGSHGAEPSRTDAAPASIELAVTACSPGSEAILKAVIESKRNRSRAPFSATSKSPRLGRATPPSGRRNSSASRARPRLISSSA